MSDQRFQDSEDLGYKCISARFISGQELAFESHRECVMAPQTIIVYMVVHGLCHLRRCHHTEAVRNAVNKVLPQYRERKGWLGLKGADLGV